MADEPPSLTTTEIATRVVSEGVAPACAAGCAARGRLWTLETGGEDSAFFDLASVTKPFTAVAFARSGIDRRTPLGELLPEAKGTTSEDVPIELLLAHRAGLQGHVALYAPLQRGEPVDVARALHEASNARRSDAQGRPPEGGFAPVYSDLGYLLAGAALARALGTLDAGRAIAGLVLEPLGISASVGTVRDLRALSIAGPFPPTEDVPWRGGRIQGAVHDENAWAMTGWGGSGHAGLFGRPAGLLTFAAAVIDALEGQGPFGDSDIEWLVFPRNGGTLRAGFDGKSAEGSSAGTSFSEGSVGHLGFVGTSLWLDPAERIAAVLLTNRVFQSREHLAIRGARPWAHDALWRRARTIR